MLKYKYVFQIKYKEAILSNSIRKLLLTDIFQILSFSITTTDSTPGPVLPAVSDHEHLSHYGGS